jgi:hypothetical protein
MYIDNVEQCSIDTAEYPSREIVFSVQCVQNDWVGTEGNRLGLKVVGVIERPQPLTDGDGCYR